MRRATPIALLPLCAWALGCGGQPAPPAAPGEAAGAGEEAAPAASGGQQPSAVDRLRALPYLNFSPEKAAPGSGGVVLYDEARASPGYNLYTLRGLCTAELADLRGRVVNRWRVTPCGVWAHAELLPGGDLLVIGRGGGTRYLLRFDFDGELLWRRELPTHHDVEQTPFDDLLVLTLAVRRETVDGEEMRVRDDALSLLDPSGGEIASVSLYDAFRRTEARSGRRILDVVRTEVEDAYDLFHANSVEWMDRPERFASDPLYGPRHVLVSIKHQDLVAILDWDTREVLWWWGRGELDGQHDATLLANGDVLVYDNGLRRKWGRALEVDPRTDRIVWQYTATPREKLYTRSLGGAQRLPNGDTLISESERGHAFEVTPDGELVWDFLVPHLSKRGHRATLVRMVRHDPERIERLLRAQRRRRAGASP